MRDASVVALHALDRAGTLCDVRKIALSVKLGLGRNWAWVSIKRLCTREEAVTIEEACEMGPAMTASIALARETLLKKVRTVSFLWIAVLKEVDRARRARSRRLCEVAYRI